MFTKEGFYGRELSRSCLDPVEEPELRIECGSKAAPRDIRHKEPCGRRGDAPERDRGCCDEDDEEQEDDKGCSYCVEPEEDNRPEEVEGELGEKECGTLPDRGAFCTLAEDKVERDPHQDVEDGPDRAKDPARRVERGFGEPGIPAGDTSRREVRADTPDNKGEGDAEDGQEPGAVPGDVHGCTGASPGDEGDGGGMKADPPPPAAVHPCSS